MAFNSTINEVHVSDLGMTDPTCMAQGMVENGQTLQWVTQMYGVNLIPMAECVASRRVATSFIPRDGGLSKLGVALVVFDRERGSRRGQ